VIHSTGTKNTICRIIRFNKNTLVAKSDARTQFGYLRSDKMDASRTATANSNRATSWLPRLMTIVLSCLPLVGCNTVQLASDKVAEMALSAVGFTMPEKPNVPLPARSVAIRLEAANDMNAGDDGKGLSVIFRVYKLKNQITFLSTPYSAFGNPDKEKDALGDSILEVKEITVSPGQVVDMNESVAREAGYIGVVALFRTPSQYRWKFAFPSADAASSGITIGLHRCALTATSTPPVGMELSDSTLLSPTKCQPI
jgi:type VI secretion system protein VasD